VRITQHGEEAGFALVVLLIAVLSGSWLVGIVGVVTALFLITEGFS
jgi:hypothetical protein